MSRRAALQTRHSELQEPRSSSAQQWTRARNRSEQRPVAQSCADAHLPEIFISSCVLPPHPHTPTKAPEPSIVHLRPNKGHEQKKQRGERVPTGLYQHTTRVGRCRGRAAHRHRDTVTPTCAADVDFMSSPFTPANRPARCDWRAALPHCATQRRGLNRVAQDMAR